MLDDINLAQLLDQIGAAQAMPLAIKDLTHRFVYVNAPFCDSVGYSAEELIGNDDLDIGRPEELVLGDPVSGWAGLWSLDNQAIKEKKLTISTEAGPGRHSSTEIVRIPLFNERGEVSALLIQLFNVTEVKDLKQRIATNVNALSMREGEISTMDSVLASLMACQDTNTLLEQLSTILVERTRADCCYAATLHESGEFMEIVAASGNHSSEYLGGQFRRREGTIGRAWHRGEAIYISDVSTIQSIHEWPVHTQAFSLPLFVDNEAVAALTVISDPVSKDLETEIPMLQRICGIASMAIANTRLIDTTQQRLKATRALAEVSQILTSVDDIAEACNLVCRILLPALDAKRASIFILNDDDDLNSLVSWGYSQGSINRAIALSSEQVRQCIAQWCVDNDQIATIGRLDEDPRESELIHSLRAEMNLGSTCCIPLKKQGRVVGAMLLLRTRDMRVFSEAHIDMFQAMVNQLSMSIDRIELARELQHQAFHDRLTGLANRHRFEQILDDVIDDAKNANRQFCVLFIDLDGFKEVNDTHGHAVGDRLLSMVAVRLSSRLDSQSTLARMGGDEFAVILYDDCMGTDQANALKDSLQSNFVIDGEILNIGASIGIGRYPENGVTANMLLQTADHAMYQAKRIGKGCVCLYNETLAVATRDRSLLETQLRDAIEKQQFHLLYQPQVRSSDSRVIGLEALIRWSHPARGLLPPAEFIPLAESSGLINQIGRWVINESVRQLASWQNTSIDSVRVSINIAAPQFQQEDFCDQIIGALQRHSLAPELLELEVTESVLMDDVEIVVSRLQKLREAGVRIAIDDFGTGYSSLSYLQDLPLDTLKIDRTFVNRLGRQSTRESLIHTIQTLATSLGLETVAEGVELPDQLEQIRHLGFDLVQGFLFSRPVSAHDIPAIVESIQHHTRAKVPLRQVK